MFHNHFVTAWDYTNPGQWMTSYSTCGQNRQSPIDLPAIMDMEYDSNLASFSFHGFDKPHQMYNLTLKNDGHTVKVDLSGDAMVKGGGLPHRDGYRVAQFHFHWGSDNNRGSEHTYSGQMFPLEINDEQVNCNYSPLIDLIMNIKTKDQTVSLPEYKLRHLMPRKFTNYFRYLGSLTTPPCHESVVWTVFMDRIPISSAQMQKFREVFEDSGSKQMVNNYRPVQPLRGRKVTTNIKIKDTIGAAATYTPLPCLVLISLGEGYAKKVLAMSSTKVDWSYSGQYGPDNWQTMTGFGTCGGYRQSPINFPKNTEMVHDPTLQEFMFHNFDNTSAYTLKLKNNGHSAVVEVNGDVRVSGGSLGEVYKTAQFHFHWGRNSAVGSEHTYNGVSYPIELHIVNYNSKYQRIEDALTRDDGLAVLGYFFEISSTDNPKLAPFIDHLTDVKGKDNETALPSFPLTNVLGYDHDLYYRYQGSLTTPGCFESVKWTVFYEKLMISESQMEKFRALFYDDAMTVPMVDNYRPPQSIYNRTIYRSFSPTAQWSYHGSQGPNQWSIGYPICSRSHQSPIDLPPWIEMERHDKLVPFTFENFNNPMKYNLTLKNNGHAAQVDVDGEVYVSGGNIGGKYKTAQFHFHWGGNDMRGSEHTYNKQTFPMELHVVNYNYAKYSTLGEAADKPDGLAVLGYFFEVSDIHNCNFAPILDRFNHISKKGYSAHIPNFKLSHVLGRDHAKYYRYQGSLTTPPCYESVTWTVFHEKLPISVEQLAMFRGLFTDKAGTQVMVDNWRPPLPRNDRKVYISFDLDTSTASTTIYSIISLTFPVLMVILS
ncbi:hypothetical protein FSP39_010505 [Pinctada imbricata]|uniref:carbonic anhydrase n=1 Tax=Pinctada imbricata TaxID=66713 RepID=A0AA89BP93_PINIB|nr:hypothetical protein FSP39_010505 [Pinctada imbricata]